MAWLEKIARPEIFNLQRFRSARSEYSGALQIQLDANENPWPPFGSNIPVNRYPELSPQQLKNRLAELYQVTPDQILITRGAIESIDLLVRTFCVPYQDAMVIMPPTFEYYNTAARINSADLIEVPLGDEFAPNWDALMKVERAKVIFVCAPNNPTGTGIKLDKIRALCQHFHERAIVIVDEAYVEFSESVSATTILSEHSNLVITRTLSKAYSLAGIRMGITVTSPDIINVLSGIIAPYAISTPCIDIATKTLSPEGVAEAHRRIILIKKERDRLYQKLQSGKDILKVYPSETNFLLVLVKDADALYDHLKSKGIIVRNFNKAIPGALRISVGTTQDNDALLSALGLL